MYMGHYIAIEKQTDSYTFACISVSTGASFNAKVDEDKHALFDDRNWLEQHPEACLFLRPDLDRVVCTIHETSPAQCKIYRCIIMRIYSPAGEEIGYVTGTMALHSSDSVLRSVWEEGERLFPRSSPDVEELTKVFLEGKGYTVR
jgi:Fe-S-cluster containining protein